MTTKTTQTRPPEYGGATGSAFAIELASDLLTVYGAREGIECTRAAMMRRMESGEEYEEGGRSKQSIVTCIDEHLKRRGFVVQNYSIDGDQT